MHVASLSRAARVVGARNAIKPDLKTGLNDVDGLLELLDPWWDVYTSSSWILGLFDKEISLLS